MLEERRIDDGVSAGVASSEGDAAARARREQLDDNREGVLRRGAREVGVLLGAAVAFCVEQFDGGLLGWVEAHWIAWFFFFFLVVVVVFLEVFLPDGFFGQTLVHARVGEDAKGEGRQEAFLFGLPEVVGGL